MLRIVDGMVFEGKPSPNRWIVTTLDLGSGHREACVRRAIDWEQSTELDPDSIAAQVLRGEREDPNEADKREANARRAARRAKTRVRRLCKAQGLDTLLTLTYRALQTDLELCKRHFQLLVKRLNRKLQGFCYVAAFEQQKRGAWHVHVCCHQLPALLEARNGVKVKSWNVVRAMWRDIVGELDGNVDFSARRKLLRSPAKCAAYVSKYVLKAFNEGDDHSKRYLASRCPIPEAVREQMIAEGVDVAVLLGIVAEWCTEGRVLATAWADRFGETVFFAAESPPH
ncbi:rolling circle replication-associated protein [Caldimonas sp. KR1-144]|uniref:rolling circle replication-associated protein n=1 Tax=Caldimonas sp. KR1-144 TaxID=3400911 RepID=UPI003BFE4B28